MLRLEGDRLCPKHLDAYLRTYKNGRKTEELEWVVPARLEELDEVGWLHPFQS